LHTHASEWFSREARLEVTARVETGRELGTAKEQLRELFEKQSDTVVKLRAFWTLYCIGAADEPFLRAQLRHPNEHVRTWAIRFLTDTWPLDTVMSQRPIEKSKIQNLKSQIERTSSLLPELILLAKSDISASSASPSPPPCSVSPSCSAPISLPPCLPTPKTPTITIFPSSSGMV